MTNTTSIRETASQVEALVDSGTLNISIARDLQDAYLALGPDVVLTEISRRVSEGEDLKDAIVGTLRSAQADMDAYWAQRA